MLNVKSQEEGIRNEIQLGYEIRDYFDVSWFFADNLIRFRKVMKPIQRVTLHSTV